MVGDGALITSPGTVGGAARGQGARHGRPVHPPQLGLGKHREH